MLALFLRVCGIIFVRGPPVNTGRQYGFTVKYPSRVRDACGRRDARRNELCVAEGKYAAAVTTYSEAIALAPSAVLYSNRAAAQLKSENYGAAIADAEAALALDPAYIKAYYRRGSALLALARYKAARADFLHVCKEKPTDRDARAKFEECDKAVKRQAFEAAIATEESKPPSERLNPDVLAVDASYAGPHLPPLPPAGTPAAAPEALAADENLVNEHGVSLGFVKALMAEFKAQKGLHKKYAQQLLIRLRRLLCTYKSLVHAEFPAAAKVFNVAGDTHGQYYDTLHMLELAGLPSPTNPFLFNGDFVDRGSFSVENVLLLFAFKLLYPDFVHLTRGNHETKNMNKMYGFEGEVKAKFDIATMELFSEVFTWLPLAVCIGKRVLVVHGGLFSTDGVKLDEIAKIDRVREPPESGLMADLMWSDPQPFPGRGPSKRGCGSSFGPDVTAAFLSQNNLDLLIRSHEVKDEGYVVEHAGKCITVFSAPNYWYVCAHV